MNKIKVLDCTLRDGGYVNNWEFGFENIKMIVSNLSQANIDIVECGFLSQKLEYNTDSSKFNTIENLNTILSERDNTNEYVCMINFGDYEIDKIPKYNGGRLSGIRVAFHKKDVIAALDFCKKIKDKGYNIFMQPMVSVAYSDIEFISLIESSNHIQPYAFYIVDSFGVLKKNDLMRLFYLVDHNLDQNIYIGFHSHNNLQLSYSLAQSLLEINSSHPLIIDSSVYGMGRGAGNLNTELFLEFLNEKYESKYYVKPILKIIDEVLNNVYLTNYWGYSLPHYLSAKENCHPNYSTFLSEKGTLTVEDISNILKMITDEHKVNFNIPYIEKVYFNYMSHNIDDKKVIVDLHDKFEGKNIYLIASGYSSKSFDYNKLNEDNCYRISVNFVPNEIDIDYVFVSNIRRFEELEDKKNNVLITTSNINDDENVNYRINYIDLLNEFEMVSDNAGLMAIKLLIKSRVESIHLIGFDGYSYDTYSDYAEKEMAIVKKRKSADLMNINMRKAIKELSKEVKIHFLTKSIYEED